MSCMCSDGHKPTSDGLSCQAIMQCSFTDFNPDHIQYGCEKNQFCQHGVCLCLPQFQLNHIGRCVEVDATAQAIEELNSQIQELQQQNAKLGSKAEIDNLHKKINEMQLQIGEIKLKSELSQHINYLLAVIMVASSIVIYLQKRKSTKIYTQLRTSLSSRGTRSSMA